jgi:hypothetical protein
MMEWLEPFATSPLARLLMTSPAAYMLVNAAHILSIGMLFGAILALDLRLLGFGKAIPIAPAAAFLSRLAGTGLCLALLTGLCLFSVRPMEYVQNPAFLSKLALIGLGLLNVLFVHRNAGWKAALTGSPPLLPLRIMATASILIWIAAVVAGRWIGFL